MTYELQYRSALESKISEIVCDRKILSHNEEYDEDWGVLKITLDYEGFRVTLTYSSDDQRGYTFLENENVEKCLITRFKFDYSDIIYSIYDVHNAVLDNKFDTYDFHCLYNEAQLLEAVDSVVGFINRNYSILCAVNGNEQLQKRLDSSFDRGLELVSKKITREKLREDPEKYYDRHETNLFLFRHAETVITDHMNNGSAKALQRFFTRESKRNHLLPFEERYLEYLFENDFSVADQDVSERVRKQEKTSGSLKRTETAATLISVVLSVALNFLIAYLCESRIEEKYWLLRDIELDSIIPFALYIAGFCAIIHPLLKHFSMKRRKDYDIKTDSKVNAVIALIGVVLIALTSAYLCFDYQKAVGFSENGIYYCQHMGKVETLGYDEVKLYKIEGCYSEEWDDYSDAYADKMIVLVKDDDFENYYDSDYMEYLEIPKSFFDTLKFEDSFPTFEDFESFAESKVNN